MRTKSYSQGGNHGYFDQDLSASNSMWRSFPALAVLQQPSLVHRFSDHFYVWDPTNGPYTLTTVEGGGGDSTEVISDAAGGVLLITNDAADDDGSQFQTAEMFLMATGKPLWAEFRIKASAVNLLDFFVGLAITDTAILDTNPADMLGWICHTTDVKLDTITRASSTGAAVDSGAVASVDTWMLLGFHYNGAGTITYWKDNVPVASCATNLSATELAITVAQLNGDATANTFSICSIDVAQLL